MKAVPTELFPLRPPSRSTRPSERSVEVCPETSWDLPALAVAPEPSCATSTDWVLPTGSTPPEGECPRKAGGSALLEGCVVWSSSHPSGLVLLGWLVPMAGACRGLVAMVKHKINAKHALNVSIIELLRYQCILEKSE